MKYKDNLKLYKLYDKLEFIMKPILMLIIAVSFAYCLYKFDEYQYEKCINNGGTVVVNEVNRFEKCIYRGVNNE